MPARDKDTGFAAPSPRICSVLGAVAGLAMACIICVACHLLSGGEVALLPWAGVWLLSGTLVGSGYLRIHGETICGCERQKLLRHALWTMPPTAMVYSGLGTLFGGLRMFDPMFAPAEWFHIIAGTIWAGVLAGIASIASPLALLCAPAFYLVVLGARRGMRMLAAATDRMDEGSD